MHVLTVLVTAEVGNATSISRDIRGKATQGETGVIVVVPRNTHNPNDMKTEMQSIPPSSTPHQTPQPSLLSQSFLPLPTAAAGFTTTWPNLSFSVI